MLSSATARGSVAVALTVAVPRNVPGDVTATAGPVLSTIRLVLAVELVLLPAASTATARGDDRGGRLLGHAVGGDRAQVVAAGGRGGPAAGERRGRGGAGGRPGPG